MKQPLLKSSILFILAIAICSSAVLAQNTAPPATAQNTDDPALQAKMQEALEFFRKNDFPKALDVLNALYKERPNIIPPRLVFAQWFSMANIPNAVRTSLELATLETPNDPEAFITLGSISLRQGELTAAEALFDKAEVLLNSYSVNPERKKNLGMALYRGQIALYEVRGRWISMHNAVVKLLQLTPDKPAAAMYRQLAVAAFQQGFDKGNEAKKAEFEAKAKEYLVTATQCADGRDGLPVDGIMCRLYLSKGEKDKAEASLAEALKKVPNSPEVQTLAAMLRLNNNDIAGAMAHAQQLAKVKPDDKETKRILATVSLYQGDYAQAEKLFQEIVTESPMDAAAVNGLALALVESTDTAKQQRGLEYAGTNAQKDQRNVEYLGTLGWALIKMNRLQDAVKALQQSAAGGQINSATAYYLAELSSRNGNFVQAKSLLDAALASPQPFFKRAAAQTLLAEVTPKAATQQQAAQPAAATGQ